MSAPTLPTTINFVGEINDKTTSLLFFLLTEQVRSGARKIRINLASNGGIVAHAISIFNFLIGLKDVHIHTHNLGKIDSGANLIFLAGKKRTASKVCSFLFHPPKMILQGQGFAQLDIEEIQEHLDTLKHDEQKMAEIIGMRIGKKPSEIINLFKERKTFSSEESKKLGLVTDIEDFVAAPGTPIFSITNQA